MIIYDRRKMKIFSILIEIIVCSYAVCGFEISKFDSSPKDDLFDIRISDHADITATDLARLFPYIRTEMKDYINIGEADSCKLFIDLNAGRKQSVVGPSCMSVPQNRTFKAQRLYLASTGIRALKTGAFSSWTNLIEIQVVCNKNLRAFEAYAFQGLTSLESIEIYLNFNLKEIHPLAFKGCDNLKVIHMRTNGPIPIKIIADAVAILPKLQVLNLEHSIAQEIGQFDLQALSRSHITTLFIEHTSLTNVHQDAFRYLRRLETLSISAYKLDEDQSINLVKSMHNSSLYRLGIKSNRQIALDLLNAIPTSNITHLDLSEQFFGNIRPGDFPKIPNLINLELNSVGMDDLQSGVLNADSLPRLKYLSLASNRFTSLLDTMSWPGLIFLNVSDNHRFMNFYASTFNLTLNSSTGYENLEVLDLSYNYIPTVQRDDFAKMKNLKRLYLKSSWIYKIEDGAFLENSALIYLDLSHNDFVGTKSVDPNWLIGLNNLQCLDLTSLSLNEITTEFLQSVPKLKYLSLRQNLLSELTESTFFNLSSLNSVDLRKNNIVPWHSSVSMQIGRILLSENRLSYVTSAMIQDFSESHLVELSSNPIECNCYLYRLLKNGNGSILHSANRCFSPIDKFNLPISEFLIQIEHECEEMLWFYSYFGYFIIIISLLTFAYWYFWLEVLYFWYDMKFRSGWLKLEPPDVDKEEYDAYIAYSHHDSPWVIKMAAVLENRMGLSLCLCERDFIPGELITDSILTAISKSHSVVMILSNDFLQSEWCLWEMDMVDNFSSKRQIFVEISELDPKLISRKLRKKISKGLCLKRNSPFISRRLFWHLLHHSITKADDNY